jgi:hypothetical protein
MSPAEVVHEKPSVNHKLILLPRTVEGPRNVRHTAKVARRMQFDAFACRELRCASRCHERGRVLAVPEAHRPDAPAILLDVEIDASAAGGRLGMRLGSCEIIGEIDSERKDELPGQGKTQLLSGSGCR